MIYGSNFEDHLAEELKNPEFQKEYMNASLEEYIEDGDFEAFFRSLEKIIKTRTNISAFAKKINLDRSNLYELFKGEQRPHLDTIAKILKELGYSLRVA